MKHVVIILHGWGSTMSGKRYETLKKTLEDKDIVVFTPDLPGFGENPIEQEALSFDDYVAFVKTYIIKTLEQTKAKKVILLGHSFGGRIAIRVTNLYPELVAKLILTGASGIPRPLTSLKKRLVYSTTKILKPVFAVPPFSWVYKILQKAVYFSIGEMDYYKSGKLKETFKNVYQVSILDDLPKISVPTLLVWGEHDTFTPLADGELMHERMKNAKLQVILGATHKLPYENPSVFVKEILPFIQ